jgi:hypothetical protein
VIISNGEIELASYGASVRFGTWAFVGKSLWTIDWGVKWRQYLHAPMVVSSIIWRYSRNTKLAPSISVG